VRATDRAVAEAKQRTRADYEAERANKASADARTEAERANLAADAAKAESKRAFRQYYVAELNFAGRDWYLNQIADVLSRLEHTRPEHTGNDDLRGFEWHYWDRLCRPQLRTLTGHAGAVTSVALNHD